MAYKLEYIKVKDGFYHPQEAGRPDSSKRMTTYHPVMFIKKLLFGRWQIDYYDDSVRREGSHYWDSKENQTPNTRLILYPSGIEQIKWVNNS